MPSREARRLLPMGLAAAIVVVAVAALATSSASGRAQAVCPGGKVSVDGYGTTVSALKETGTSCTTAFAVAKASVLPSSKGGFNITYASHGFKCLGSGGAMVAAFNFACTTKTATITFSTG